MKWVLATYNQHKLQEMQAFIIEKSLNIQLLSLSDIGFNQSVPETGTTFTENALIKAKIVSIKTKYPVLSDDSGLIVEALNGAPGIFSARYAGNTATDSENNQKLLNKLENKLNRKARFICVLCLFYNSEEPLFFKGSCLGKIGLEVIGEQGFGYDPLFIPEGYSESFATLGSRIKKNISHRTKALELVVNYLERINE